MQIGTLEGKLADNFINFINKLFQAFAGLSHIFPDYQTNPDTVALGDVTFDGYSAGLFAAKQDIFMNHNLADIFKTNLHCLNLQTKMFTKLFYSWGDRKGNHYLTSQYFIFITIFYQKENDLLGINKVSLAVIKTYSISIAIGSQAAIYVFRNLYQLGELP